MNQESLNKFLATVRRTRFIDYLDPIGVTAQEALAQRIRWAQRNLDDPQHGEEAAFLLSHAKDLAEVLKKELEVDADDEWTDVFAAVKADSPLLTWMRRDDLESATANAAPSRTTAAPPPPPAPPLPAAPPSCATTEASSVSIAVICSFVNAGVADDESAARRASATCRCAVSSLACVSRTPAWRRAIVRRVALS